MAASQTHLQHNDSAEKSHESSAKMIKTVIVRTGPIQKQDVSRYGRAWFLDKTFLLESEFIYPFFLKKIIFANLGALIIE